MATQHRRDGCVPAYVACVRGESVTTAEQLRDELNKLRDELNKFRDELNKFRDELNYT